MSDGDGGGGDFGGGDFADAGAADAQFAETAPFDHDDHAHVRHEPPARITFDYVPASPAPLEAMITPDLTALPAETPSSIPPRSKPPGFWTRLVRSLAFWR